jgi:hypothetical protein
VGAFAVVIGAIGAAGCGTSDDDGESGSADIVSNSCGIVSGVDGHTLSDAELSALNDPVAKRVILGGCPQKLDGIIDSLHKATDCAPSTITTRLVSDRSLLLGKADSYRAVLSQECSQKPSDEVTKNHDLFVSFVGITTSASSLPQTGAELIGHDTTAGVFNYYVNDGGWKFMGSSKDALEGGYTCGPNGDCFPKAASKARCFACHESGGINMKELNSPWNAWGLTGPFGQIHSDDVFARFGRQLGTQEGGFEMQVKTEAANAEWSKTRVQILKDKGAAELLRPLFCTLTVNLGTSDLSKADSSAGDANLQVEALVETAPAETRLNVFAEAKSADLLPPFVTIGPRVDQPPFETHFFPINAAAYNTAIAANQQKIVDAQGNQLVSSSGKPVVSSPNGFVYVKKGDVDQRYIARLVAAGIVDKDFVMDVQHVDFTRPIFSPTRCGLLDAAPALSGAQLTPDAIREGFKNALKDSTKPGAAQLLKNLGDTNDGDAHVNDVRSFLNACKARKADFVPDFLRYTAHVRAATKAHRTQTPQGALGIIEFSETLPTDNLPDTDQALDPTDCTLK